MHAGSKVLFERACPKWRISNETDVGARRPRPQGKPVVASSCSNARSR
jgi:hypothetical protein